MISEFIHLIPTKTGIYDSEYSCELPDIDNDEDVMIQCGTVKVHEADDGVCFVKIELIDKFLSLCVGDTYQQKHFVQTILEVIGMQSDYDFTDAKIEVQDFTGVRSGKLNDLDESFY